jgi:RhtB (resistance to homoserine/threonine) family protein
MTGAIDPQVVAFTVIAGLLTITPGADTMLVIRNVMARGRRAGLLTSVGACCGLFIHATLSALGLSLILVRSATTFEIVKMIGAGYLVWLGIQSLRQAFRRGPHREIEAIAEADPQARPPRSRQSFVEGLLSNVLNPKVAVFYLAFLPQFMNPGDWVFGKSMLLAGIHWIEGVVWMSIVTLFVARLRSWINQPRVRRAIEATTGAILIAFGVRLAMERAR